jgi:mRNA-degrading endonuclease toxin of MazEF toxin-antitoxin module
MPIPAPEKGLVIRYEYVWRDQDEAGREEAVKDRPCMVVGAITAASGGGQRVFIVPFTTAPPRDPDTSLEIPANIRRRLGLDDRRSWIRTDEANIEDGWPQSVVPVPRGPARGNFAYGTMPVGFFQTVREHMGRNRERQKLKTVKRAKTDLQEPQYRRSRPGDKSDKDR